MIFVLDNFDSFTYNIVQYLQQLGCEVVVRRNNAVTVDEVMAMNPEAIVLSPGPGRPEKAGIMLELIDRAKGRIPLLGICLGHQAIGLAFGGKVVGAKKIMHGKISEITHDGKGVFAGLASPLKVVRYHSLAVDRESLPAELEISAQDLGFSLAAYEKLACEYEGDDLTIGFKSTFLIEILSNIDCTEIVLKFADGTRPAVIVPSEEEEQSEKICGILMPSIA